MGEGLLGTLSGKVPAQRDPLRGPIEGQWEGVWWPLPPGSPSLKIKTQVRELLTARELSLCAVYSPGPLY